jgi:hypothetical protein
MASQSDHGSGPSEYLSGPEQHRRLDLSASEPTFHTAPDHEPDFVLTLTDPEFAEFLMQRLQLAVAKDVRISPTLRSCLEDIDKHDILNKIDVEVSYVSSSQDGVGIPETCRCKFSLSMYVCLWSGWPWCGFILSKLLSGEYIGPGPDSSAVSRASIKLAAVLKCFAAILAGARTAESTAINPSVSA